MWLVSLALRRPYTIVIIALLIFIFGVSAIITTPTDIAPRNQHSNCQRYLDQAIHMALENNLDIRLEQIDQSVADFSVKRSEGGAVPRSINYNIAQTPAGVVVTPVPLLSSTASTLSPNGILPSGITIPSSYNAGYVLEAQHSLSIATVPFSLGSPVPVFDFNLLGQYGWIRRDPNNLLVTSASATAEGYNDYE